MLKVGCMICGHELDQPGAILLASPCKDMRCAKYHICVKCEKLLSAIIGGLTIKMALKRK
jgi:hypothetical protein